MLLRRSRSASTTTREQERRPLSICSSSRWRQLRPSSEKSWRTVTRVEAMAGRGRRAALLVDGEHRDRIVRPTFIIIGAVIVVAVILDQIVHRVSVT